ncbi:MAG TPA: S16 family serine protease [Acidobacteriota bacterium]|nr:S16 family serine protease [Acidobacteriota bacterium]
MNDRQIHTYPLFSSILFLSILICAFAVSSIDVHATERLTNSMKLLAVSESSTNQSVGGVASLTLEIVPGFGRVFIDTYPFTKLDTQISTRLAKEIACSFLQKDCNEYDFIYTIKSGSAIIGGPSAGAAMAALTVATLDGATIDDTVSLSGTINSGGIIGSVGGLAYKIKAAGTHGITTVLIPMGERYTKVDNISEFDSGVINVADINSTNISIGFLTEANQTVDLVAYGESIGVRVIEVSHLYDVMPILTDTQYPLINESVALPEYYVQSMGLLAAKLCERAFDLNKSLQIDDFSLSKNSSFSIDAKGIHFNSTRTSLYNSSIDVNSTYNTAQRLLNQSYIALGEGKYYSAASFCYGAGINLRFLSLLTTPLAQVDASVANAFDTVDINMSNLQTITDLQTFMLVSERVTEAKKHLETARNQTDTYQSLLSYVNAYERLQSAVAWSIFYDGHGPHYELNDEVLSQSCEIKIQEAQERFNFVDYYISLGEDSSEGINRAIAYQRDENYALCLLEASKAKASFDVIANLFGVEESQVQSLIVQKSTVANQVILQQSQKGIFPIIGYSYYEYANSLAEQDPSAALQYLQFSLELSNLDIYFPIASSNSIDAITTPTYTSYEFFGIGIAVGLIVAVVLYRAQRFIAEIRNAKKKKRK